MRDKRKLFSFSEKTFFSTINLKLSLVFEGHIEVRYHGLHNIIKCTGGPLLHSNFCVLIVHKYIKDGVFSCFLYIIPYHYFTVAFKHIYSLLYF